MEMWFLTMMWDSGERPKPGTKFILKANGRSLIVVAGYETGPSSSKFLGGVTPEVHKYLGTTSNSDIWIDLLSDQSLPIGPVKCSSYTLQ